MLQYAKLVGLLFFVFGHVFNGLSQAVWDWQNHPIGATDHTQFNGTCSMHTVIQGTEFNTTPRYTQWYGSGLFIDHNWSNSTSFTLITITFNAPIVNPTFDLNDINRNGPCTGFCSSAWTDRVTVSTTDGIITATSANPPEHTITANVSNSVAIEANMVCNGTNAAVTISISGTVSTIILRYDSGSGATRNNGGSGSCGGDPSGCFANQSSCPDPGRQYIAIGNITGQQCCSSAEQPPLACYETATYDAVLCTWNVTGTQPPQPSLACYQSAVFNSTTCQWDVTGSQPAQPTLACDETAVFNSTTCQWDITQNPPAQPPLACYETATYNIATCQWDVSGSQPAQPTLACDETAVFNAATCQWDITQNPPAQPPLACYETATYNTTTCQWDVTGSPPAQPTLACDETAVFNSTTCQWDITQNPPAQPPLACYETATYNIATCQWDVSGTQPAQPTLACYETAVFNTTTCQWEVSGEQPEAPITECYETAVFNTVTCSWDVSGEPIDFTVSGIQPTCANQFGALVITGLAPNTTYSVAYNQGAANTYTSNQDGEVIINSLSGGTYTNFTLGIGGCAFENSAIIELIEIELPEVYAGEDQVICEGEEVILSASNYGAASLAWSSGVENGVGFYLTPGIYNYTVSAQLNNCTAQDEVQIEVFAKPFVDAGEDVSVCTGNPVILVADYNQGSIISWDNAIQDGIAFTPSISQYYTVTATSSIGCVNSDSVFVAVLDLPAVGFNSNEIVGCAPLQVQFESIQVNENVTCMWDFGNGTTSTICDSPIAYYDEPGCYPISLTVQSTETGCISSVTYEDMVCVVGNPIADFYTNTTAITATDSYVQTTNVSSGATSYYWDFGNGITSSEYSPNIVYDALSDGYVISLVVENEYGCKDTARVFIDVEEELIFYVPNAFTPDNDQYNQVFQPVFSSGFDPYSYQLIIFNRWGEVIFESFDHTIGWDGSYGRNGEIEMCQDGTYIWKIYFKSSNNDERKSVTGHVSLLR